MINYKHTLSLFLMALCVLSLSAQTKYHVVAKQVNVFAQPDANSKVVGQKVEGDIIDVYSKMDGWACIAYDNATGFVDLYCVKPLDEETAEMPTTESDPQKELRQQKYELVLNAGTEIPIQSVSEIRAKQVKVGQTVQFKVSRNVIVDGLVAIPSGTIVEGIVCEAVSAGKEKWKIKGARGKVNVKVDNIVLNARNVISVESRIIEGVVQIDRWMGGLSAIRADIIPAGHETVLRTNSQVTITVTK